MFALWKDPSFKGLQSRDVLMNGSHLAIANAIQTSLANDFHEIQGVILSKVWNQLLEKNRLYERFRSVWRSPKV